MKTVSAKKRMISSIDSHQNSGKNSSSVNDLVPANLAKARGDVLPVINAKYTKVGESIRRNAPNEVRCSMFCGGKKCKYENSDIWKPEEQAVSGIYSHWITDDIMAMARPNTTAIKKHKMVDQFQQLGLKSIINLQTPGEHASCGPSLHESGFTYDPADFMKANIFFYNFAWKDFGEASMVGLLDMVKVLSFALSEGKVAVHCHAGLGRTGVLIAAYLVYYLRVRSNDALRYVRLKRPGAVQTRRQIECVKEFEAYFLPQCMVFSLKPPGDPDKRLGRFTVDQSLKRQKYMVHGFEARALKHIPKLLFKIGERLLKLCNCGPQYSADLENFTKKFIAYKFDAKGGKMTIGNYKMNGSNMATRRSSNSVDDLGASNFSTGLNSLSSSGMPTPSSGGTRPGSETNSVDPSCSSALSGVDDRKLDEILGDGIHNQTIYENLVTQELQNQNQLEQEAAQQEFPMYNPKQVFEALLQPLSSTVASEDQQQLRNEFLAFKIDLNNRASTWSKLEAETNLKILSALFMDWMEHLKSPILDRNGITYVVIHCDNVEAALHRLPNHVGYILEYLVRFVIRLHLNPQQVECLMMRFVAALTHQCVDILGVSYPDAKLQFPKLRGGTADSTLKFMLKLMDMVEKAEQDASVSAFKEILNGNSGRMDVDQ